MPEQESHSADLEQAYNGRKEKIQKVIDECAARDDLDEFGTKTEIADKLGLEDSNRVHYVLNEWEHLIEWRRKQMESNATSGNNAVTDSAGAEAIEDMEEITVEIELTLDQAFRAVRNLPDELGAVVFKQVIGYTSDDKNAGLERLFD